MKNNGLTNQSMKLTAAISEYLGAVSKISDASQFPLFIMKGQMLKSRIALLKKDLKSAAKDQRIRMTALQIAQALEIEENGLDDVIASLTSADQNIVLSKQAVLAAQIEKIKEKL